MTDKTFTILVAEDDNFQRMALLDILTLCDYNAIPVENGIQALEQLKNENNEFDLVLLDLYMPEMDGFEVLARMQEDERLSQVPIVVMSSMESNDIISNCLKMGAMNYLVKPIRIQQCKALVGFIKSKTPNSKKAEEEQGLGRFETLHELGTGAAGIVHLVRNKVTGEKFALKTMSMAAMNKKDKESAESEVEFLRVITGPTIIKFYESFVEN